MSTDDWRPKGLTFRRGVLQTEICDVAVDRIKSFTSDVFKQKTSAGPKVVHEFGWDYDSNRSMFFGSSKKRMTEADRLQPIPDWALDIWQEAKKLLPIDDSYVPDHCMVNTYEPGQGIYQHLDHQQYWGSWVVGVVIGSGATMLFTRGNDKYETYVEPNSLYLMEGEARTEWTHGVVAATSDKIWGVDVPRTTRYAVTFRSINPDILPTST